MAKIPTHTRWSRPARALMIAAFCASGGLLQAPASAEDEDRPVIKVPRGDARELFQNCVLCHKYDGRGGPSEGGYGADLRVTKLTRDEVIGVITNGRAGKGMPPFQGILDDDKIARLATFVKEELKLK